jgi:4-alpha-glucanotransferase
MTYQDAAAHWGILPGYHDVFGKWHEPSQAALDQLLPTLKRGRDEPAAPPAVEEAFAFQCGHQMMWGLAVQLYAVRSARNWGHGDFGDLQLIVQAAASAGASAVGLNPLHALFPDRAEDASPYSPSSRFFLNWLYIDIESLDEFPGADELQAAADNVGLPGAGIDFDAEIVALRAIDMVAYARVAAVKRAALRICHARFRAEASAAQRAQFAAFVQEGGETLIGFAAFQVLRTRFEGAAWRQWPREWQAPERAHIARLAQERATDIEFELYLQWTAERQLRSCQELARSLGMPIGLYIDMAVGVHPDGADAWSRQNEVLTNVNIGAPPDQYNPAGQNWGLTTFNPHALAQSGCEPLRQMLRAAMRHAGAIRIDHVLGLMRLYLIPVGASAADGAYVRFPFEPMLSAIAQESAARNCIVIGEDLGTVPDGFRDTLRRFGIWTYLVMLFEREDGGGFRVPEAYAPNALATFSTHDLPTFAGWMSGSDLTFKRSIGVDPGETDEERARSRDALKGMLGYEAEFPQAAHALGRSAARLVMIGIEDIIGIAEQINIPGTVEQHPNWRRRLPQRLDEILTSASFRRIADVMRQEGRAFSR